MKIKFEWCTCKGDGPNQSQVIEIHVDCSREAEPYVQKTAHQVIACLSKLYNCDASVTVEARTEYRKGHVDEV